MRRRRKKFFVPFPSWTPIVVGLSSDGSDFCSDTSDLGDSAPLETLEEEIEMNSEEERCPSSKGESAASEASNFDAATELDEEGTDLAPISDFPHGPDILGLPDPCIPFDLAAIAAQVCPNISISSIPRSGIASSSNAKPISLIENISCSKSHDPSLIEKPLCPDEFEIPPSNDFPASIPTNPGPAEENLNQTSSRFNGQWSNLFANNRKPVEDYMMKKVEFPSTEGCLDFSDASSRDKLYF
ncbi:hypothetical protein Dimus_037681 [Dionaea muscipula]